jgi:hypothetical protein
MHTYGPDKMADDVNKGIEAALNTISITTERSGNVKKELKNTIYENVSTLRKLFAKLIDMNDSKTRTICELETLVANTKAELDGVRKTTAKGHAASSLIPTRELARTADREVALPGVEQAKL